MSGHSQAARLESSNLGQAANSGASRKMLAPKLRVTLQMRSSSMSRWPATTPRFHSPRLARRHRKASTSDTRWCPAGASGQDAKRFGGRPRNRLATAIPRKAESRPQTDEQNFRVLEGA